MSSSISYPSGPRPASAAVATAPATAAQGLSAPPSRRDAAAQDGPEPRASYGWGETYAALDLGTNNCRLLVARANGGGFRVIDAFSRIVRLGEGVNATGVLSEAAILRTLDALKVCAAKIAHRGVTRARYVATEACRRAENFENFFHPVPHAPRLSTQELTTAGGAPPAANSPALPPATNLPPPPASS